jgi:hypothetical protein
MVVGTSVGASTRAAAAASAASGCVPSSMLAGDPTRRGDDSKRLSRSAMMSSFGDRGLPVFQAGHTDWHRPHSVQVRVSSSCFQERSSICPAPNTVSSETFSMSMSGVL